MPTASVITTVYNGEAYFDRAIPSILSQTFKDFEFLIVNDGSDDSTEEKLQSVRKQDSRIRLFNPGRLGFAKALNYALKRARGQYIIRQDFDDESFPARIEKQVRFLDENPRVGLVAGYCVVEDERRGERYTRMPPLEHDEICRAMSKYIPFAHTLVALRKSAIQEARGFVEADNIVDLRTWINVGAAGWRFANIPEPMGVHYIYQESFWHRNFTYRYRQRDLAGVQRQAISKLHLPKWRLIYPLGRYLYYGLPDGLKKIVRRGLAGSKEEDIQ